VMAQNRMEFLVEPGFPTEADSIVLILLPGARTEPEEFLRHGFASALRERGWPVIPVPVRAHLGYYLDHSLVDRLDTDVLGPLRSRGHTRFWLAGISLGGLGVLSFLRARPHLIEGTILIAPFLATTGLIAEVALAGGLDAWQASNILPDDPERQLLGWLKKLSPADSVLARLYLGYGRNDRFAAASALLAERLPARRIALVEGGHDWEAWTALWHRLLDLDPFALQS
jgi:pimeloyl-ACP methyl ester carboxylesterase